MRPTGLAVPWRRVRTIWPASPAGTAARRRVPRGQVACSPRPPVRCAPGPDERTSRGTGLGGSFIAGRRRALRAPIGVESNGADELRVRVGPQNRRDLRRLARHAGRLQHRQRPGSISCEQAILWQAPVEPAVELSRLRFLRPGSGDARRHRAHARGSCVSPPVIPSVERRGVLPVKR